MNKVKRIICFIAASIFLCEPVFSFAQEPKFSDFRVPIYNGPEARLNLAARNSYEYRTRLRAAAAQPINFGGHYHLGEWGCGTDCLTGAIIDALTGSVWFLPAINGYGMNTDVEGYNALRFRADSNLLLVSGIVGDEQGRVGWHYFLFPGSGLKEIRFVEWHPKSDAIQAAPAVPPVDPQKWAAEKENMPTSAGSSPTPVRASPLAVPATSAEPIPSSQNGKSSASGSLLPLLAVLAGLAILISVLRIRDRKIRTRKVLNSVFENIEQHKRALVRKKFQTLRHDDYGNIIREPWLKEVRYFVEKVLDPAIRKIGAKEYGLYEKMRPAILLTIASQIEGQTESTDNFTFGPNLTPLDYEQYCAQQLRSAGWVANVTKASGDQGADIVAEKGSLRLVVQCKLYTHPVGNKAVQEIAAARAHEQADCAAVVTCSRYTNSAQQLATTNGVLLLHHTDLRNIDDLISA